MNTEQWKGLFSGKKTEVPDKLYDWSNPIENLEQVLLWSGFKKGFNKDFLRGIVEDAVKKSTYGKIIKKPEAANSNFYVVLTDDEKNFHLEIKNLLGNASEWTNITELRDNGDWIVIAQDDDDQAAETLLEWSGLADEFSDFFYEVSILELIEKCKNAKVYTAFWEGRMISGYYYEIATQNEKLLRDELTKLIKKSVLSEVESEEN